MSNTNFNFKKSIGLGNVSIPRCYKDENLVKYFQNGNPNLNVNKNTQSGSSLNSFRDGVNNMNNVNNINKPPINSSREFGKDLTNSTNPNLSFNYDKKPLVPNKFSNLLKPTINKKILKNDISLYNLRPRNMPVGHSLNNSRNNSANNSFSNNFGNENVNTMNMGDKKMNNDFNDKMEVDTNPNTTTNTIMTETDLPNKETEELSFRSTISISNKNTFNMSSNSPFNKNPQKVFEFIDEIHEHLKATELQLYAKYGYMKQQRDINEKMRSILIDWIVDVHLKFKLLTETLFLTTQLIDRYLEKTEINRNKLQLIGVSALFIACKYEEIYPPELKDFVYITDKAYTKEDILKMEYEILKTLDFSITSPSALRFLEVYLEVGQIKIEESQLLFAKYLLELFLIEYRMLKYPPSWIAAATLYISLKVKKFNSVDITKKIELSKITGYTEDKIKECARDICIILDNTERSSLQAVRNKYSLPKFLEVAKWKKN
jgi:hypothetical protein